MVSSIHWLLMFVNAANKDVAVGRFRVPAARVRMHPGKQPKGEISSLGITMLVSS